MAVQASSHQTFEVEILNIISFLKSSHRPTIKKPSHVHIRIPHLIAYMAKMTSY